MVHCNLPKFAVARKWVGQDRYVIGGLGTLAIIQMCATIALPTETRKTKITVAPREIVPDSNLASGFNWIGPDSNENPWNNDP
jgi:hypothetical protein